MTHRVLVCGKRDYTDSLKMYAVLDQLKRKHGENLVIITGGASGADRIAAIWAIRCRVDLIVMHARWDSEGKAAGPRRNERMLEQNPDEVLAFSHDYPNSRGTRHMISLAEDAEVKVTRHD